MPVSSLLLHPFTVLWLLVLSTYYVVDVDMWDNNSEHHQFVHLFCCSQSSHLFIVSAFLPQIRDTVSSLSQPNFSSANLQTLLHCYSNSHYQVPVYWHSNHKPICLYSIHSWCLQPLASRCGVKVTLHYSSLKSDAHKAVLVHTWLATPMLIRCFP